MNFFDRHPDANVQVSETLRGECPENFATALYYPPSELVQKPLPHPA
ncbi:MAG: hypothetical protein ACJAZ9_000462 [Neolewinella sp.]|jgi:hypothetical protein